jgi:hypothetical protein
MSKLLDQAIVEAEALREAAYNSAEAAVIEKYSHQIKEAVEQMLEQDDFFDTEEEEEVLPGEEAIDDEILDQIKTSAEEEAGMKPEVCLCPDDEEGDVEAAIEATDDETEQEPGEETVVLDLARLREELDSLISEEEELEEAVVEEEEVVEEEIDLTEQEIKDAIKEIAESLTVDLSPQKSGWAGTPASIVTEQGEQLLAKLQDDEHNDDFKAINKAVKELQNENKNLKKNIEDSSKKLETKNKHIEKLTEAVGMMKEILEESNVVNAKLLYKVKVLENDSLNERQKSRIAEKLSEAKSVEEAKLIFETLQSSVGSTKRHPESLSEAVERSSSTMLLSRKRESTPSDQVPALGRWQKLAGLK